MEKRLKYTEIWPSQQYEWRTLPSYAKRSEPCTTCEGHGEVVLFGFTVDCAECQGAGELYYLVIDEAVCMVGGHAINCQCQIAGNPVIRIGDPK